MKPVSIGRAAAPVDFGELTSTLVAGVDREKDSARVASASGVDVPVFSTSKVSDVKVGSGRLLEGEPTVAR